MAKNSPESEDDFLRMQQEAIRRVRDMQTRARATLENAGMHIENSHDITNEPPLRESRFEEPQRPLANEPHESPRVDKEPQHKSDKNPDYTEKKREAPQPSIIPPLHIPSFNLSLDSDQIILVLLIYLLIKDGADKWMILSLAYVLMT